jgi:hypothetical protein
MPLSQIVSASIEDGAVAPVDLSSVAQYTGFKNRLINGGMVIDQRNAGASVAASTINVLMYVLDRWGYYTTQASKFTVQQNAGTVAPPSGFTNYLGVTVGASANVTVGASDLFLIGQRIEGFNYADIGMGQSWAQPVSLSFWVRSSLTGTFGGSLTNGTNTGSFPFLYTVSLANTWQQITISVPAYTAGTWNTTNGNNIQLYFALGVGSSLLGTAGSWSSVNNFGATGQINPITTNGATFYITGVQLEKGVTATSFDYRPYTTELQLCQRYYYKQQATNTISIFGSGFNNSSTISVQNFSFPVPLRIDPTAVEQSGTASHYQVYYAAGATVCSAVPAFNSGNLWGSTVLFTTASGLTTGQASMARSNNTAAYLAWSAEL